MSERNCLEIKGSRSASEITELDSEGVDVTCRAERVDRWGILLDLRVPGDPPEGNDPSDWCRESPATVGFLMVT